MHTLTARNLLLLLTTIHSVLPHPHSHDTSHLSLHRRQNFADPALYKNVDWSKVDYSGGGSKPAPSPAQPPAQPAPAPQKQDLPKTEQKNSAPAPAPNKADDTPSPPPTANKASTPSNSGGGYAGGKRGLAYNHASPPLSLFSSTSLLSNWCYNWNSAPDTNLPDSIAYVPMLHSLIPVHTDVWAKKAQEGIDREKKAGRGAYLMAFNEPDIPSQANLDVGAAVGGYRQYLSPFAGKAKLGSPAVSNGVSQSGRPMGLAYLKAFLTACSGCQVDFLPVHWYGCTDGCPVNNDIAAFKTFVGQAVELAGGRPVWVTEFQRKGAEEEKFVRETVKWLEAQGGVERFAYFMVQEGSLVQGGKPSKVGEAYAGA